MPEKPSSRVSVAFYDYMLQSGWARDLVLSFLGVHMQGELPLIAAKGLSVAYDGQLILDSVNLDIFPGDMLAVVGLSGAGKTTLLQTLAGLERPSSGMVTIKSGQTEYRPIGQASQAMIGVSLESPALIPELSVEECLMHFAVLYGLDKKNAKVHVDAVLELSGLVGQRSAKIQALAFGFQRKVDIALAVLHNPQIVFLDHPFEGLDPHERADIARFVLAINKKGVSVVMTAPSAKDVAGVAKRLAVLKKGRFSQIASVQSGKFTVGIRTLEQNYNSLAEYARYFGASVVSQQDGTMWCRTDQPETLVKELAQHLSDSRQSVVELWCDANDYGAH